MEQSAHKTCMNCDGNGIAFEADPEGGFGFNVPCGRYEPDTEFYF